MAARRELLGEADERLCEQVGVVGLPGQGAQGTGGRPRVGPGVLAQRGGRGLPRGGGEELAAAEADGDRVGAGAEPAVGGPVEAPVGTPGARTARVALPLDGEVVDLPLEEQRRPGLAPGGGIRARGADRVLLRRAHGLGERRDLARVAGGAGEGACVGGGEMEQLPQQGGQHPGQAVGGGQVGWRGGVRLARGDRGPGGPYAGDERGRPAAGERRGLVLLRVVVRALGHRVEVGRGGLFGVGREGPVLGAADHDDGVVGELEAGQDVPFEDDLVGRQPVCVLVGADGVIEVVGGFGPGDRGA